MGFGKKDVYFLCVHGYSIASLLFCDAPQPILRVGHDFQLSMDEAGMVANPARGRGSREVIFFPSPFAPEQ